MKIIVKEIKPMFTSLVTTMNKLSEEPITEGGIIDTSKARIGIDEFQEVLAIGPNVRDIKVGDLVSINPTRFGKMVHHHDNNSLEAATINHDAPAVEYEFPVVKVNGQECLFLQDRDINYIVSKYDKIPKVNSKIQRVPVIVGAGKLKS